MKKRSKVLIAKRRRKIDHNKHGKLMSSEYRRHIKIRDKKVANVSQHIRRPRQSNAFQNGKDNTQLVNKQDITQCLCPIFVP